ncbi:MAG: tetratricopeptide repeat protein [Mycobacteriales bacterium]
MGTRRALVIGSQCDALGAPLACLPSAAEELRDVLLDPALGGCEPAVPDGAVPGVVSGLLLDPHLGQLRDAVGGAFRDASRHRASLFLAYVGHGVVGDSDDAGDGTDLYLMSKEAPDPPDDDTGYLVGRRLYGLLKEHRDLDGLVVLLDACHAGTVVRDAGRRWVRVVSMAGRRFEVLSSSDLGVAREGCFTRTLSAVLRSGDDRFGDRLRCEDVRQRIAASCPSQTPWRLAFDGRRDTAEGDEGLWLARNAAPAARQSPLAGTLAYGQVMRLTTWFQRTAALDEVVAGCLRERCLGLVGPAGYGKSTLVAALARPELAPDRIPARLLNAVAFLAPSDTVGGIARTVAQQLALTVPGFRSTVQPSGHGRERWTENPFERYVFAPLRDLDPREASDMPEQVRIALDGLDQLGEPAARALGEALSAALADPRLPSLRLLVTSREEAALPAGTSAHALDTAADADVDSYLAGRGVDAALRGAIVAAAAGSWLVARMYAEVSGQLDPDSRLPVGLDGVYEQQWQLLRRENSREWERHYLPTLTLLATAGTGPVLPLALLRGASEALGGPGDVTALRDVIVRLGMLVVRGRPGTENEHVGLFHPTFVAFLRDRLPLRSAHQAMVEAIGRMAPAGERDPADPVHAYATLAEAGHLWELGRYGEAVDSLERHHVVALREWLERCQSWHATAAARLGERHQVTLRLARHLAEATGKQGRANESLRMLERILAEQRQVLEPGDPQLFLTRFGLADQRCANGQYDEGLRELSDLLADQERALGATSADAFRTRAIIAKWTARAGQVEKAIALLRELLAEEERVLGPTDPKTFRTRGVLAYWTAWHGEVDAARKQLQALHRDQEEHLGPGHPDTLYTGRQLVAWRDRPPGAGHRRKRRDRAVPASERDGPGGPLPSPYEYPPEIAAELLDALEARRKGDVAATGRLAGAATAAERCCGPRDYRTLALRSRLADWTWQDADRPAAVLVQQRLHDDLVALRGPEDARVEAGRRRLWRWRSEWLAGHLRPLAGDDPALAEYPAAIAARVAAATAARDRGAVEDALSTLEGAADELAAGYGPEDYRVTELRYTAAHWWRVHDMSTEPLAALTAVRAALPRYVRKGAVAWQLRQELVRWQSEARARKRWIRNLDRFRRDRPLPADYPPELAAAFEQVRAAFAGDPAAALESLAAIIARAEQRHGRTSRWAFELRLARARWTRAAGDPDRAIALLAELHEDVETGGPAMTHRPLKAELAAWREERRSAAATPTAEPAPEEPVRPDAPGLPRLPGTPARRAEIPLAATVPVPATAPPSAEPRPSPPPLPPGLIPPGLIPQPRPLPVATTPVELPPAWRRLGEDVAALRRLWLTVPALVWSTPETDPHEATTVWTRAALLTAASGEPDRARRLLERLATVQTAVLGERHPATVGTGAYLSLLAFELGDLDGALRGLHDTLTAQREVCGQDHPDLVRTELLTAVVLGESWDLAPAADLLAAVLPRVRDTYGPTHPLTGTAERTRASLSALLPYLRDEAAGRTLLDALDHATVTGGQAGELFHAAHRQAARAARGGRPEEAVKLLIKLIRAQAGHLTADHPDMLAAQESLALVQIGTGWAARSLKALDDLATRRRETLGPHHPATLLGLASLAYRRGTHGHPDDALRLYRELVPALTHTLGPHHPDTLRARANLAYWQYPTDPPAALDLLTELARDQLTGWGPHHPDLARTQHRIRLWTEPTTQPTPDPWSFYLRDRPPHSPDNPDPHLARATLAATSANLFAALATPTATP